MQTRDVRHQWEAEEAIYVDQKLNDNSLIHTPRLDRCVFENISAKGLSVQEGHITATRFRNCYFRQAVFEQVNLTGCEFVNCNLRKVKFKNCYLDYVRFRDCVRAITKSRGGLATE
jgi:uncharacterized protein YjbI with pentapeptide repeats